MVAPMESFQGYVTYMQFALGTAKGGVGGVAEDAPFSSAMANYGGEWEANTVVNSISGLGEMTENRANYTGQAVVEVIAEGQTKLSWTPVLSASVVTSEGETAIEVAADGTLPSDVAVGDKVKYIYDNQYIPQKALPTLVGRMAGINLEAKARRIAVYYSQFAAFQSKTDYGMDFESTIAQQAQAELQYQIDSQAVYLVKNAADAQVAAGNIDLISWVDEELDTISYAQKARLLALV